MLRESLISPVRLAGSGERTGLFFLGLPLGLFTGATPPSGEVGFLSRGAGLFLVADVLLRPLLGGSVGGVGVSTPDCDGLTSVFTSFLRFTLGFLTPSVSLLGFLLPELLPTFLEGFEDLLFCLGPLAGCSTGAGAR